ncbi:MAG: hypothetical protein IKP17_02225 [Oscillospiraceae bacterium]|nr:hypothetical protein [Oscillospiraceae bacterium]
MRRFKEPVKTVLILLLALSAVFLAWKGSLFTAFFPQKAPPSPAPTEDAGLVCSPASLPVSAAVTLPGGLRFGVKYDSEQMGSLYESFSALLAEALGSAGAPEKIGEAEWRDGLRQEGLWLDYGYPLPIAVLAAWVGVEAAWAEGRSASACLLVSGDAGSVFLCFRDGNGDCFRCATSASRATLRGRVSEYRPNGAAFAFESEKLGDCDPCFLVLEQLPELYVWQSASGQQAAAQALGERFGINLGGQSRYTEADGTLVYPGESGVLRLTAEGAVAYSAAEGAVPAPETAAERIEWVRRLLEAVRVGWSGAEELYLRSVEETEDGLRLTWTYALGGVAVELASGPAASALWRPSGLGEIVLRPLSFRQGEAAGGLLPEKQAAAVAGSLRAGSEARLVLQAEDGARFAPVWTVAVDGRSLWTRED